MRRARRGLDGAEHTSALRRNSAEWQERVVSFLDGALVPRGKAEV